MPARQRGSEGAALPARRREDLLAIVQTQGQATVNELAELFGVSLDTVRRDIDQLADRGLLARTHGGAVRSTPAAAESTLGRRLRLRQDEKRALGHAAAALVADGETLLVNGGTTTLAFAAELGGKQDLTVVTNSLVLPDVLPAAAVRDVYVLGGGVRLTSLTTIGPVQFPGTPGTPGHRVRGDLAVIGVGSLSVADGVRGGNLPEAQTIREMIESAAKLMVIADSSKADYVAFAEICPLSRIDVLVSDLPEAHPVNEHVRETGGLVVSV